MINVHSCSSISFCLSLIVLHINQILTWLSVKVKNNSLKLLLYWFFNQKRSYFSSMKCLFDCLTLISWIIYLFSFFHCTKKFRSITKQSRCSKHQDNIRHHLTNVIQRKTPFWINFLIECTNIANWYICSQF